MIKLIGLLFFAVVGLTSCDNQHSVDSKAEAKKLNDFLRKYEEPSQLFKISSDFSTQFTSKQGTIISINPSDLVTESGQPLGNNIEVELKELTTPNQLLKTNAQTVSDGQLLISGGAYYINLTSDGQQLKLKEGKSLEIQFPKLSNNEMSLFYGQRDSLGQINWKQANENFKAKDEQLQSEIVVEIPFPSQYKTEAFYAADTSLTPMTKEEKEKHERETKLYQEVYNTININSFGWINCDRFFEIENKTDLLVKFNSSDNINYANIYLVFKDINSVMQCYYFYKDSKTMNQGFSNIPIGFKARLLAYTVKDEKVYSYFSDLTITYNQTITLAMKETSEQDFKKLIGNN